MCIAGIRWMSIRVDFLSALFVGLVAIAGIITSQDAGNNTNRLVEHRTGIAEVMGLNPVGASGIFLGFICNFTTARITFMVMGSNPVGVFSGLKLLHNCEDLFHLYSLSAVHSYDLYEVAKTGIGE